MSDLSKFVDDTLKDTNICKYYSNGFVFTIGTSDVLIVFQQNGIALFSVNVSFTTAKTLAIKLGKMITDLEENCESPIMTTDTVEKVLLAMENKKNDTLTSCVG